MGKSQLNLQETRAMFIHLCGQMIARKDLLTQADKVIGDGDHGVGMARGFEAVQRTLEGEEFTGLDALLKAMGRALMMSAGGASGAVFGTFFRGGARQLAQPPRFDSKALSCLLQDGLEAVKQRGQAKPGDKTMVDALEPAARKAEELASVSLDETLIAVSEAARLGMEQTKDMVATVGKAKTLGERSLGYPDPGALSVYLILMAMSEYATGLGRGDHPGRIDD